MFSAKSKKSVKAQKSKKLKRKPTVKLNFIVHSKRTILCINFIKYAILLYTRRKKKNLTFNYFLPLFNYLMYDKTNFVIKLKYRIYKQKLLQISS